MTTTIFMDGKEVATLGQNMFTRISVGLGEHSFTTSTDKMWGCQGSFAPTFVWPPVIVKTDAPGTYFLKFTTDEYKLNKQAPICERHLAPGTPEAAVAEIGSARYVKPVQDVF